MAGQRIVKRIFSGSSGFNNVDDPVRIKFDPKTAISDLQHADNVRIDPSGRVTRRQGRSLISAGAFHSLFRSDGDCFTGKTTLLYQVLPDLTLRGVRSGLSGGRIRYTQHGDRTYYSNAAEKGVIENSVSSAWTAQEYVGPEDMIHRDGPPTRVGLLCMHKGSMYLTSADEPNVLYRSEPFQPGLYDRARSHWRFASPLLMIVSVDGGLFISDSRAIYFMNTQGERETLRRLTSYPALEYSECPQQASAREIGFDTSGMCAFWLAESGACVGLPDGSLVNMTEKKIRFPEKYGHGATLLMEDFLIGTFGNCVTLCINTELGDPQEKAASQFTSYGFNSYAEVAGRYLGAGDSGLYAIEEGKDDSGTDIAAGFAPVMSDFGDSHPKRLRYLDFGYEADGDLQVTVTVDEQCEGTYILEAQKYDQKRRRLAINRNLSGRYWTIKVENLLGCDFSVDTIDAVWVSRPHGVVNG